MDIGVELEHAYKTHRLQELHKILCTNKLTVPIAYASNPLAIIFILLNQRIPFPAELAGDLLPNVELITEVIHRWEPKANPDVLSLSYKIYTNLNKLYAERRNWIMPASYWAINGHTLIKIFLIHIT
jgi:hypothetical protein